jgi:hypothetical protein
VRPLVQSLAPKKKVNQTVHDINISPKLEWLLPKGPKKKKKTQMHERIHRKMNSYTAGNVN